MRIFVHGVDTYLGKALVKELLRVEASNPENTQKHRIFGTVIGKPEDAPKTVKRVLQGISSMGGAPDPKKYSKFRETMSSCSLIIIDLFSATLDDLHFAISCLKVDPKSDPPKAVGEPLGKDITFVLISSAMVWAGTPGAQNGSLRDADYKRRQPLPGSPYEKWKEMEDLMMNCFNREESTVKGIVVAPGVLYGDGEDSFGPLFKKAWLGEEQRFVELSSSNLVPTVHVRDLARLVREIGVLGKNSKGEDIAVPNLVSGEDCPYYIAVDRPPAPVTAAPLTPTRRSSSLPMAAADAGDAEGGGEEGGADGEGGGAGDGGGAAGDGDAEEGAGVPAALSWRPLYQADLVRGIFDEFSDASKIKPSHKEQQEEEEDEAKIQRLREASALNLHLEPSELMLKENFAETCEQPGWWCATGLLANLPRVASEFCKERKLRPMFTLIAGPPASGKSTLAKSVAEHYNVPHLTLASRANDEAIEDMVKRLSSKVCRYRGYVLDAGYASFETVDKLFRVDEIVVPTEDEEPPPAEEDEEAGAASKEPPTRRVLNDALCPDFVVCTQATEELCRARWRGRGAGKMDGYDEAIAEYRAAWGTAADDQNLSEFFQRHARREVLNLPIAGKDPDDMLESVRIYMDGSALGRPFNYLQSEDDVAAQLLAAKAERDAADAAERAEVARREAEDKSAEEEEALMNKRRLQIIAAHEEECRKLQAIPLRAYIMDYITPTLTEGLVEVCRVFPDDPTDYLASYLERAARQGRPTEDDDE
eukprot:TRINITY_DN39723_c0_g1_i1.p1 TRINITY_DN39723_c0_g1~~TRINITY_DN39723_c0_g1_i1.p1  ORF type:complete len:762 (+),score=230.54 TRINITY_DN39723_c0_g1_i1:91-2376(+)